MAALFTPEAPNQSGAMAGVVQQRPKLRGSPSDLLGSSAGARGW